ncbi:phospholipase D-like protein [Glaciihabitans tibetensis]|uniref:Phospholipase D-like protein n=1 Tax=Glaciihabitans tibetensis TaxID=1266600 RepID=A0A2T0VAR3_9MICO|nr:SHOCT domain-containing protein [Glaciihabitans tibetensis]PRY67244.1 phospholipase D-like protein [Glaciihabitans tibetensis]
MDSVWSDFWSVVWLFLVGFAFVVYLFAVITVLRDIYRDRTLNGWGKAAWTLFLIFVPFLTVLVYVIARGAGMVDRLEPRGNYQPPEDYAQPQPLAAPASEIKRAKELVDAGVITPGEFEALKSKALGNRY